MNKFKLFWLFIIFFIGFPLISETKEMKIKMEKNLVIDESNFNEKDSYFRFPIKVKTDSQGNIFILDANRIIKFSNDGKFLFEINRKGTGPSETINLQDFDVKNDILWMCDQNLQKILAYSVDGKYIKEFRLNLGSSPYQISVDKKGFIYVNFLGVPKNYLIHRFDREGNLINSIVPPRFSDNDIDLKGWKNTIRFCIDNSGNILLSFCFYNIVQKISPTGKILKEWKLPLNYIPKDVKTKWLAVNHKKADGDIVTQGITIDNYNNIYVIWGSKPTEQGIEIDVFNPDSSFKTRFFSMNQPDADLLAFHFDVKNNFYMLIPLENPSLIRYSMQWIK